MEDDVITLLENAPVPQGGYGLIFSESMAQAIAEFTASELYKKLKSNYALQKKDRIARQALNSAHDVQWLHYYKGMAAAVDLFFRDMESVSEEYKKQQGDADTAKSDRQHKR